MVSWDEFFKKPRRIIAAVLVVAAVVGGFALAYAFGDIIFYLFVGVVLATALNPAVEAIQRCGIRRPIAVALVYACIAWALLVVTIGGAPPLVRLAKEMADGVPHASQRARQWLADAGDGIWAKVARRIVAGLSFDSVNAEIEQLLQTVGRTATYLAFVAQGLLAASFVVLFGFYSSLQGDRTVRWLLLLLPVAKREEARDTIAEIAAKLGAYIRGQCLVCVAMAGMASVAYSLLGLRYASVLGVVAGLLEVMPVLGPILGAVPPLIVTLLVNPGKAGWVLAAAILMQQIESYLIVPRIMDKSVGVHPMVTLLAIAGFGTLFGIAGAILAIPLAAILQVLLNHYVFVPATTEQPEPEGRGRMSVLQYESQQILFDVRLRDKAGQSSGESRHLAEAIEAIAHDLDERLKNCKNESAVEGEE